MSSTHILRYSFDDTFHEIRMPFPFNLIWGYLRVWFSLLSLNKRKHFLRSITYIDLRGGNFRKTVFGIRFQKKIPRRICDLSSQLEINLYLCNFYHILCTRHSKKPSIKVNPIILIQISYKGIRF